SATARGAPRSSRSPRRAGSPSLAEQSCAGLSCCYHAKDNLMCRDVCEQVSLFLNLVYPSALKSCL
uniref:Uncharacterized protein n=1 Tax=Dromaius novaehollandiae TaxID=8790 RepID=A0A8C4KL96_DRONO